MKEMAKLLMLLGAVLFVSGVLLLLALKSNLPFGKLPGDISYEGKHVKLFAPVTSMIVISVLLTVILNVVSRFLGKR